MDKDGCAGPSGRTGYPSAEAFYAAEPRARHDGPGQGPADDDVVVFDVPGPGAADESWQIVHNHETGQVYAHMHRRGGAWSAGKYVRGDGADLDGPVQVLGYARDRAALDGALNTATHGDPIGFLTGRDGAIDWVTDSLAGSSGPPPP